MRVVLGPKAEDAECAAHLTTGIRVSGVGDGELNAGHTSTGRRRPQTCLYMLLGRSTLCRGDGVGIVWKSSRGEAYSATLLRSVRRIRVLLIPPTCEAVRSTISYYPCAYLSPEPLVDRFTRICPCGYQLPSTSSVRSWFLQRDPALTWRADANEGHLDFSNWICTAEKKAPLPCTQQYMLILVHAGRDGASC